MGVFHAGQPWSEGFGPLIQLDDDVASVTKKFDELLKFMHEEFEKPAARNTDRGLVEFAQMRRVFREQGYAYAAMRTSPPGVLDSVFVVGIARELLALNRIVVSPLDMSQWEGFSDRYQDLILDA